MKFSKSTHLQRSAGAQGHLGPWLYWAGWLQQRPVPWGLMLGTAEPLVLQRSLLRTAAWGQQLLRSFWRARCRGTTLCPCSQPSSTLPRPGSTSSPASPGARPEMMPHAKASVQCVPLGVGRSWLPPSLSLPQALTFPTEIPEIGQIIYWLFPDCCLFGEIILEIRC